MPRPKGLPKSGGRGKGTPNKVTAKREAEIAASGLTPLDYMVGIMRSDIPKDASPELIQAREELRFEAAKAAAPYVHPRLASTTLAGDPDKPDAGKALSLGVLAPVTQSWRSRPLRPHPQGVNCHRQAQLFFMSLYQKIKAKPLAKATQQPPGPHAFCNAQQPTLVTPSDVSLQQIAVAQLHSNRKFEKTGPRKQMPNLRNFVGLRPWALQMVIVHLRKTSFHPPRHERIP